MLILSLLLAACAVFPSGQCAAITGYWEEQNSGVDADLLGLCFVSEEEGWVVGTRGVILHTTDGGETWEQQDSGKLSYLYGVSFPNPKEGWVVGLNAFLRTTDGGETWATASTKEWNFGGRTLKFQDIVMRDPLNGWIADRGGYVIALAYGDSPRADWLRLREIDVMYDVDFLDENVGWCAGENGEEGAVYRTLNGGSSWGSTRVSHPVRAVHFIDAKEGWAVGEQGAVFHSPNGGVAWEWQDSGTDFATLKDVFFTDERTGWAVGEEGLILKTLAGGRVWSRTLWNRALPVPGQPGEYEDLYPELNRVVFVDPLEGWIVGEEGTILHFTGEYETIPAFSGHPNQDPTIRVRRGSVVLGSGGHPWSTSGTGSDVELGEVLRPVRLNTQENLVARARDGAGKIWSTVPIAFGPQVENVIDDEGMSTTLYEASEISGTATVYVDLGAVYPVYLLLLKLAPNPDPAYSLPQHIEIGLNSGDPEDVDARNQPILYPIWSEPNDGYSLLRIEIPPEPARYVGITVSETPNLRLRDLKVFGDGYFGQGMFLSKTIDFDAPSVWGMLRWEGKRPPDTEVILRTRVGDDDDPNMYWRRIGETAGYTNLTDSGEPMTRYDYEALPEYKRGEITFDTQNWTGWSAPYPFEEGEAPIQSPDGRQYLQIQAEFRNAPDAAAALSSISVEASNPASAYLILGEIVPAHAAPAQVTTFTYGIRPRFRREDIGFDTVEISTPVSPSAVHRVVIDSTEVAFTSEIREDPPGLRVRLPELAFLKDNAVVEIVFDCAVFRYGTGFPGHILNSRYEGGLPQRVVAGDALKGVGEDMLTVQTELETPLLLQPCADPDPFTPNGDGINDETELSYTVLKLFALAPVRIEVYDLAGRLVRRLYEGEKGDGVHVHRWDGRDEDGRLVRPGIYAYRVELDADADRQAVVGIVHVVY